MDNKLSASELSTLRFIETRPVAYRPEIAKALKDVKSAILLSQFLYWSKTKTVVERGGWFYKTSSEIYEETGLSKQEQETARKKLTEYYILETKRVGMPAQNWYRVDLKKLISVLGNCTPQMGVINDQLLASKQQEECQQATRRVLASNNTIYTESTQESTHSEATASQVCSSSSLHDNEEVRSSSLHNDDGEWSSVVVDDWGEEVGATKKKKDTSYRVIFSLLSLKYPSSWERNTSQIKAAKALLQERGVEQVERAISYYKRNASKPFIPEITTPYDLDTKWEKLLSFKNKEHGAI
jgi:hypothetical protein